MKLPMMCGVALLVAAGCGGNTIEGTVGGLKLQPQDAVFANLYSNGKIQGVAVVISDRPNICATFKANRFPKNSTLLSLTLLRASGDGNWLAPDVGEYAVSEAISTGGISRFFDTQPNGQSNGTSMTKPPIVSGAVAAGVQSASGAIFNQLDVNCTPTLAREAQAGQSGLVKVAEIKTGPNGRLSGTFDITFGSQKDKTKGAFSATYCDLAALPSSPSCE